MTGTCSIAECNRPVYVKQMCSSHYHQEFKARKNPDRKRRVNITEAERFWQYVQKTETCWNWTGGCSSSGYGVFATGSRVNGTLRCISAHRYVLTLFGQELQPALQIDHLCRNRVCVNPDHLEQVTAKVNTLRSTAPSAVNAQKTECHRGHPFDDVNTYFAKGGHRQCRTCGQDRHDRYKAEPSYSR